MISDLFETDPRQIGPYRLLGRLGAGGMGVVYLASSPADDVVAVKLIRADLAQDADFRGRFSREVGAARRVGGVCTARVRDADLEADRPWVVTDFVAGPNLADLVTRHGPLPADQQRALAIGLAEALAAVHSAGVVHRDLKPTNVLCSPAGPRLIDFGIAQAADATSATLTGQLVGSPSWMAPEQIRGQVATPAIDMFALGSLLVFAATGRPPFGQGQMEAVMYRILNEAPDLGPAGALAPELVPLVGALLDKEPAARPSPGRILTDLAGDTSDPAQEVTAILDRTWVLPAGEALGVPAAVEIPVGDHPRSRRRRWKTISAASAVAVAAALLAAFLLAKPAHNHKLAANSTSTTTTTGSGTTAKTDPPTTPLSSRQVLAPATIPPKVNECSQQLTFGVDGNAGPVSCSNGDLNVVAWRYLAGSKPPSVMSLGPYATPSQVEAAMCADGPPWSRETSAYQITALYYGWSFTANPSTAVVDRGCSPTTTPTTAAPTTTTPTTTTPLPVLYIPVSASSPGYSGRYPTVIAFSVDGGNIVGNITWSSWGPQEAVGHGTWTYQNCVPDCADGSQIPYPATITLSDPAGSTYTTITEVTSGPEGSTDVFTYGSQGWSDTSLAAQ